MGIREYFKQHPEGEDLKLQNMTLKEKKRRLRFEFDSREEITSHDWYKMIQKLEELDDDNELDICELIMNLTDLSSMKGETLDHLLFKHLYIWREIWQLHNYASELAFTVLFKLSKFDVESCRGYADRLLKDDLLYHIKVQNKGEDVAMWVILFRRLFPNDICCEKNKEEQIWNDLKEGVEVLIKTDYKERLIRTLRKFRLMVELRPDKIKEIKLPDEIWEETYERFLEAKTKGYWIGVAEYGAALKVMAESGVFKKSGFKEEKSKRPERRSF